MQRYFWLGSIFYTVLTLSFFATSLALAYPPQTLPSTSPGCIKVFDGGQAPNNQTLLKFINACPIKLRINVCVQDKEGNAVLYKSPQAVPITGRFYMVTFPDVNAQRIQWTAAMFHPPIPGMCVQQR